MWSSFSKDPLSDAVLRSSSSKSSKLSKAKRKGSERKQTSERHTTLPKGQIRTTSEKGGKEIRMPMYVRKSDKIRYMKKALEEKDIGQKFKN